MHARKADIKSLGRLKGRPEFLRIQQQGTKWTAPGLTLEAAPNAGEGRRYGLTVSKRFSKSAVERNRLRRRLRALALETLPLAADNTDYVLVGRAAGKTRAYADLKKDLGWCLSKLKLGPA